MRRFALMTLVALGVVAVVARWQGPEIQRYLKIRQM